MLIFSLIRKEKNNQTLLFSSQYTTKYILLQLFIYSKQLIFIISLKGKEKCSYLPPRFFIMMLLVLQILSYQQDLIIFHPKIFVKLIKLGIMSHMHIYFLYEVSTLKFESSLNMIGLQRETGMSVILLISSPLNIKKIYVKSSRDKQPSELATKTYLKCLPSILCINLIEKYLNHLIINKMERKCLSSLTKRRYAQISIKRRESFVESILQKGLSVSQASKRFNIKLSTAKLILKKYKETGKFFPKKQKKDRPKPLSDTDRLQSNQIQPIDGNEELQQQIHPPIAYNQQIINYFSNQAENTFQPIYCLQYWFYPLPDFDLDFHNY